MAKPTALPAKAPADAALHIVPANEASWDDLKAVLTAGTCHCQRFKIPHAQWRSVSAAGRAQRFRAETRCGNPRAATSSGLVAYLGRGSAREPVAWCAVEPRSAYARLAWTQVPWIGRTEDKRDSSVWAVTCFVIRPGYRRRGLMQVLARAAAAHAKAHGARAVEGYAMITRPGEDIAWGELHVGSRNAFAAAGFKEVSRPTKRRAVMRMEF